MTDTEELIRNQALKRLSRLFAISIDNLKMENVFGIDLKSSFVSDFKRNELDQVLDDIYDVADRQIYKELAKGTLTVRTVGDYCEHMIRCSKTKLKDVNHVLGIA